MKKAIRSAEMAGDPPPPCSNIDTLSQQRPGNNPDRTVIRGRNNLLIMQTDTVPVSRIKPTVPTRKRTAAETTVMPPPVEPVGTIYSGCNGRASL